jgi:hypothetical protein
LYSEQREAEGGNAVIDLTYADRLRGTIERKIQLHSAFRSRGAIEDNEREIRKAQAARRAVESADIYAGVEREMSLTR